jgi:hypothetical protein
MTNTLKNQLFFLIEFIRLGVNSGFDHIIPHQFSNYFLI